MSNSWNAASSDLDRARLLIRSLRPEAAPEKERETPVEYPRFQLPQGIARPAGLRSTAPDPPLPVFPAELIGGALWDRLLEWCMEVAQANTAFVMDAYGLLVSSRGPLGGEEFEEIGARLIVILEQARQMQTAGVLEPAVGIEISQGFLTGFQMSMEDGSTLTVGFIGSEAIPERLRVLLKKAFYVCVLGRT